MSRSGATALETRVGTSKRAKAPVATGREESRRRYTVASLWGLAIGFVPFLYVLWNGRIDPLRAAIPRGVPGASLSAVYDLQARALFHGSWDVPKGFLGFEAFVVHGRDYTYFGPFAAFLRMPILALTDTFDGRLTAPSMLLAWVVTAVFLPLLMWRVRHLLRGPAPVHRTETMATTAFIAAVMGGSVIVYLAALPWVYHEDLLWSIALLTGVFFMLLGVLERPTVRRVVWLGAFIAAAVLNRSSTGWACVIAALAAAAWFASGRGGEQHKRWWWPVLAAGVIPVAIGCAVTWMKFGAPFSLPLASQVWTKIDRHRRDMLAANGGRYFNPSFLPSTLFAYFRPTGLRLTSVFPFITLPAMPPRAVGGVFLDRTYRTASVPASMPFLFLVGGWGLFTAFRSRTIGLARLIRIPLVGGLAATVGVLVWGYISNRYTADFMPLLIVAGAVGLVDITRRLETRPRRTRKQFLVGAVLLVVFSIVTQLAISFSTERLASGRDEARRYVEIQKAVGELTGTPVVDHLTVGEALPPWAPADRIFVLGNCDGLYISNGEFVDPWVTVELPETHFRLTFNGPTERLQRTRLLTIGAQEPFSTVWVEGGSHNRVRFGLSDKVVTTVGDWARVDAGRQYKMVATVDTWRDEATLNRDGSRVFVARATATGHHVAVRTTSVDAGGRSSIAVVQAHTPRLRLCNQLRSARPA